MTFKTLIIAPHADDELLGCGGLLLRRKAEGGDIGWVLLTSIRVGGNWDGKRVSERDGEINLVREGLKISPHNFFNLGYFPARLDQVPFEDLVASISKAILAFQPSELLVPYAYDAHSDHRVTYNAAMACTKWFRYPSIRRVLAYETLSESNFISQPQAAFSPNVFVDITQHLEKKLSLLSIYKSEICEHPFPRSLVAVRALSSLRGSQSGHLSAEGFQLIIERS